MTPKEKAEELYRNYWVYFTYEQSVNSIFKHAKQCALIAVDEIMKSNPIMPLSYMLESEALDAGIDYWKEVKQEIEKL